MMKAIILAGGLGERLRPLTEKTPKPLLPIQGKPIIQRCIENLRRHGVKDIILSIGYKAEQIQSYFKDGKEFGVKISYNIEDQPLGTGGAVRAIIKKFHIRENFLLLWGDNLADFHVGALIDLHRRHEGSITMVLTPREGVENFGVARLEGNRIAGFVEKPKREEAPSKLINAGAFVIDPEAIAILPEGKSSIEKQCFEPLAAQGKLFALLHEGYWFPTDTLEKYQYAENEIIRYLDKEH